MFDLSPTEAMGALESNWYSEDGYVSELVSLPPLVLKSIPANLPGEIHWLVPQLGCNTVRIRDFHYSRPFAFLQAMKWLGEFSARIPLVARSQSESNEDIYLNPLTCMS